jgi:hypothetical protein
VKVCKLCLQIVDKLEDSHFLSAGIYRRLRDEHSVNPNPVLVTPTGVLPTSKQAKAHLLCRECEQLLSKQGESWVLANCLQADGRFPLATALAARTPDVSSPETPTRLYYAAGFPKVNISALTYFAASIFWRGAIHPWCSDGTVPVPLGSLFQEELRKYLIGLQPFPHECFSLLAIVREGKAIDRLTYFPAGNRIGMCHSYRFPMPGFCFMLFVGKHIPTEISEKCFVAGNGNPLVVTSVLEPRLFNEGVMLRRRAESA